MSIPPKKYSCARFSQSAIAILSMNIMIATTDYKYLPTSRKRFMFTAFCAKHSVSWAYFGVSKSILKALQIDPEVT
ncbi:hypothetical protein [Cylindrospermopsis curvispora]|uniref:Uncharacterized protein n=1 Tax=Cylindrospermopsis curvispora GIHE-G1 TaxID=2666332 RepID=A0A7H0EWV9_9CYAN|nr:hypothetical protein [Cylindrospermopsis curvispora]QNP28275.1 hypothetical protein IAR63_10030 [Cylindrospermopsis curvispora GIHE-G1]